MKPALVLVAATPAIALALGPTSSKASTTSGIVFAADRAPSVTGEIYRLDPNGHRIDLSRSPYQDTNPVVSPDGKHVAFFSDRGDTWAVYEVGINGRGLRRLGPAGDVQAGGGQLTWQPRGRLVAVSTGGQVWIDAAGQKPVVVKQQGFYTGSWSQDGRVLLLSSQGEVNRSQSEVDAVAPSGSELWRVHGWGGGNSSAWSPQGLLAISVGQSAAIYDEGGHLRLSFALPTTHPSFSWSPDGRYLAASWSGPKHLQLEVRTSNGSLVLKGNVPGADLSWASNFKVVAGIATCSTCRDLGADVRTGKLSPASSRWLEPRSADGKLAIVTPASKPGFILGVAPPAGGPVKRYARLAGCFEYGDLVPAAYELQFAGSSRSLVYVNWNQCDPPLANLYSVAAGGGHPHRLTNVQAQETQPSLSPDGTAIAFVWASNNGISCSGCSDGIRIASPDGHAIRTLTDPQDCTFDDSPTWSPDGTTILFSEDACDSPGELFTIPATGGTPHDLGVAGSDPAWGPTRIAYQETSLWTANPDGSDRVKVAQHGSLPAWSSDGRLAYLVGSSLVVGNSSPVKLPFARVTSLGWTPGDAGLVITASKTKLGPLDVYTIHTDGTHPVRLTKDYGASGVSGR